MTRDIVSEIVTPCTQREMPYWTGTDPEARLPPLRAVLPSIRNSGNRSTLQLIVIRMNGILQSHRKPCPQSILSRRQVNSNLTHRSSTLSVLLQNCIELQATVTTRRAGKHLYTFLENTDRQRLLRLQTDGVAGVSATQMSIARSRIWLQT